MDRSGTADSPAAFRSAHLGGDGREAHHPARAVRHHQAPAEPHRRVPDPATARLRAEAEKEEAVENYRELVLALRDFALTLFLAP